MTQDIKAALAGAIEALEDANVIYKAPYTKMSTRIKLMHNALNKALADLRNLERDTTGHAIVKMGE